MEKWALFGTGQLLEFYNGLMKFLNISPLLYVDNDCNKWGRRGDIEVSSPQSLLYDDYNILISCGAEDSICKQLLAMGICADKIYTYSRLLHKYSCDVCELKTERHRPNKYKTVIIDAYEGLGWGGMEMWSYRVAEGIGAKHNVVVYGSDIQKKHEEYESIIKRFAYQKFKGTMHWASIYEIAKDMERRRPFVLINNWSDHVMAAALIVKKRYPADVFVISMVHNDAPFMYRRMQAFEKETDLFCGVSKTIGKKLIDEYGFSQSKVISRNNFVISPPKLGERKINKNKPIRIGWGARIEKFQKRADLIPLLINTLEKRGIKYRLDIAGSGEIDCINTIEDYILSHKLSEKIFLRGFLTQNEMVKFWNDIDIYINFSDFEGSSLAMLEAMSCGAVPVVTNVSGVSEIVSNDNGVVVPIGDMDGIVSGIEMLDKNRDILELFSKKCVEEVNDKCDYDKYIQFLTDILGLND